MKNQLFTLLILVSSLLDTNADEHCDILLQQCNEYKTKCSLSSPKTLTIKSCCDLTNLHTGKALSGVYHLMNVRDCMSPSYGAFTNDVYCDMQIDGGGWTVIQRNVKDEVSTFNRKWNDYEEGFGDINGNKLWYGLRALSCLTQTDDWELRIDFQFKNKTWSHLHYTVFSVGSASDEYPLSIGGLIGTTTDPFSTEPLDGKKFSTFDNDNDWGYRNCASDLNSGWWYNDCFHINANYQPPAMVLNSKLYNLLKIEMKIRPRHCISQ